MVVLFERHAKGRAHLRHGPGEPDAPPGLAGLHDRQVMSMGERDDLGDVFRRRTMIGRQLLAGQISALFGDRGGRRLRPDCLRNGCAGPEPDRHFDPFVGMGRPDDGANPARDCDGYPARVRCFDCVDTVRLLEALVGRIGTQAVYRLPGKRSCAGNAMHSVESVPRAMGVSGLAAANGVGLTSRTPAGPDDGAVSTGERSTVDYWSSEGGEHGRGRRKVLVTGGHGPLGSHLAERLIAARQTCSSFGPCRAAAPIFWNSSASKSSAAT